MTRAQARRQGKARRRHLKFGDKVGELMEVEASYAVAIGPSEAANDTVFHLRIAARQSL